MKKVYLTIPLLCATSVSYGKDFRAVDVGENCDGIAAYEADMGSEEKGVSDDMSYFYTATFLDTAASVVYNCQEGVFSFGFYSIRFPSVRAANAKFPEVVAYLQGLYGEPYRYELEEGYGSSASWLNGSSRIMLNVTNVDDVKARLSVMVSGR